MTTTKKILPSMDEDDENADWLHRKQPVQFSIYQKGKLMARCNIETSKIETKDSELEEFFYLLVDEGLNEDPISAEDSQRFVEIMKRAGYEAKEQQTATDASTPDVYPGKPSLEAKNWDFQGLIIDIENLRGSTRHGASHHTRLNTPYGFIRGSVGADGDEVDVFVGAVSTAPYAFVIHTKDPETGKYDEDKVILGVESATEAKQLFDENYDRPGFFESMERMTISHLKRKLKSLRGRKLVNDAAPEPEPLPILNLNVKLDRTGTRKGKVIRNTDGTMNFVVEDESGIRSGKVERNADGTMNFTTKDITDGDKS